MSAPDFIIFLPVRNGGAYLDEAVGSIVAQTDAAWSLVVLENASTDDTVMRLARWQDRRITVIPADRPLDMHANWHRGFEWLRARSSMDALVTFIGHDDLLGPDFVARIRALAEADPAATLYQTHFDLIDAQGGQIRPCRPIPASETWQDMLAALCWGIRDSFGTGYAFRAADYARVGGIPDLPRLLYADHLLFTRLAQLGHKRCDAAAACAYRLHAGSASNGFTSDLISAQIRALSQFVDILRGEAAPYLATDQGKNALAALLGRQLGIFDLPAVRRTLSRETLDLLASLREHYAAIASGIAPAAWNGRAFNPGRDRIERIARGTTFIVRHARRRLANMVKQ